MKIQEIITDLSSTVNRLSEIKMDMIADKITKEEAENKCAVVLENVIKDILTAIDEWKK